MFDQLFLAFGTLNIGFTPLRKFILFLVVASCIPLLASCRYDVWNSQDDIPNNFVLGERLYFHSQLWGIGCRAGVYKIRTFDPNERDLETSGFNDFQVGYFYEKIHVSKAFPKVAKNSLLAWECLRRSSYANLFRGLIGAKRVLYSYHESKMRFLFYDPDDKLLYHLIGGG